jgi:hypothetical protein
MKTDAWVRWAVLVLVPIMLSTAGFALSIERRVDKLEQDRAAMYATLSNISRVLSRIEHKLDTYDTSINTFYQRGPAFLDDMEEEIDRHEERQH